MRLIDFSSIFRTLNLLFLYLYVTLFSECWWNRLLTCISFIYQNNNVWPKIHFKKKNHVFTLWIHRLYPGARIDHSHHDGSAYDALGDTIALSDAVEQALSMTDPADTPVIVTADHSHTLAFAGYPARGNPILGTKKTKCIPYTRAWTK